MIETKIQDKQIFITQTVVDIFCKFRQFNADDSEMGGIILGQVSESGDQLLICRATIPSTADKRGRTHFRRNKKSAQKIIEYEFHNSEQKNTYLGEWHTHPSKVAIPSSQDLDMIKGQFKENDMKVDFIIMVIVAQEELFLGLHNGRGLGSINLPI
jgi:integrative and conjugative element protein (TIGR02256 family)